MKVHILESDQPHTEGTPAITACGVTLPSAMHAMVWDEQLMGLPPDFPVRNICRACLNVGVRPATRYLYGITEKLQEVA